MTRPALPPWGQVHPPPARGSVLSEDGCIVGPGAGLPGSIVVEAVRDMRLGVDLAFQALE